MITKEILEKSEPWTIIATWLFENNEENVFLTRDWKKILKFVAIRWQIPDWCVYYEDPYRNESIWIDFKKVDWKNDIHIAQHWSKIYKSDIKKIIKVDEFAFKMYRW